MGKNLSHATAIDQPHQWDVSSQTFQRDVTHRHVHLEHVRGTCATVHTSMFNPHEQTGLAPGVELAIQMTPAQAREIGEKLIRKAHEAEATRPPH
jgi:hypothetical protein